MMKHNKQKNVGVLFEVLNHAVLTQVAQNNIPKAQKLFSLLRENFVKSTEISKAYKIYSQFLYSEARNVYFASRFVENLTREYNKTIKHKELDSELNTLMEQIAKVTNKKEVLRTQIPNYKTLASFHIKLHEDQQYLSSRDRLTLDENLFDHLIENQEAKRVRERRGQFENPSYKSLEEVQTGKLSLILAIQKFDEAYKHLLTTEQKGYLVKYYTSADNAEFKSWVCKKVDDLLDEVADKSIAIEDKDIKRKIELVTEKLQGIAKQPTVTTSHLKDILLSVEMKDKLKLF
jgi:polyhydroxyalkanoate synthesis regulator phasin